MMNVVFQVLARPLSRDRVVADVHPAERQKPAAMNVACANPLTIRHPSAVAHPKGAPHAHR